MEFPQSSLGPFFLRISYLAILFVFALLPSGAEARSKQQQQQQQQSQLQCSPANLRFGATTVGQSGTQVITLTNTGQTSVTISTISATDSEFAIPGNVPIILPSGQSVSLNVIFAPNTVGWIDGEITFASNAFNSNLQLAITGKGAKGQSLSTPQLAAGPSTLAIGNVVVGAGGTAKGSLTASNASVTVTGMSSSNSAFSVSGFSLPVTIPAGQSVPYTVTFSPQTAGAASATLTFTSNAQPSASLQTATGTGAAVGQLSVSPVAIGSVVVGSSGTASGSLSASGASVTVTGSSSNNSAFSISGLSLPATIPAGNSVPFTVAFSPQTIGSASATLTFISNAQSSNTTDITTGTGTAAVGQLSVSPGTVAIGNVVVGSSATGSGSLTAIGASVTVTGSSSNSSAFSISGLSLPVTIPAGNSVPFTVTFSPQSSGSTSAALTFISNAQTSTLTDTATGTGTTTVGQLGVSPGILAVGNVVDGSNGTVVGSLNASGASITVTAANTNNSVFSVSGLSLPVTIPAGQSVPFVVTFSPQTSGVVNALLTFASTGQSSTTTASLTGTGTTAPTYSVNLSWNASGSSNIYGYNIYRAVYTSACGAYSKVNSTLNTTVLYTDLAVTDGTSYCYATTAVNTSNQESGYSNIASNVQIPAQ